MEWDSEAEKIIEEIPLPPIMGRFARMDAERRACSAGLIRSPRQSPKRLKKAMSVFSGKRQPKWCAR